MTCQYWKEKNTTVAQQVTPRLDKTRTYIGKDTEDSDPQNEEDAIPSGNDDGAILKDEGNEVAGASGGRQGTNHDGIDL